MIVWSRGLGKQRLPLDLAAATLTASPDHLALKGVIEPVCWDYAIMLSAGDLRDFLKLLAKPETARFLSERGGLLIPFVLGLTAAAPGLMLKFMAKRAGALFGMGKKHALLV
ncbi:MAG: hypothetical protein ACHP84_20505 [Caulobacterales bacterium]